MDQWNNEQGREAAKSVTGGSQSFIRLDILKDEPIGQ
jgi:hypothetical protein